MKKIGKIIAPFFILILMSIVGYLLLVLVYSIDTDRMQYNAAESAKTFFEEGKYPKPQGTYTSQLDSYSDAIMVLIAAHESKENAWQAAINNERDIIAGYSPEDVINLIYVDNAETESVEYSRYWHGYLVLLKPALCFLDYKEIRYFVMAIELFLFTALVGLLARKNSKFIFPMALTWLCLNPVATMLSLQFCYVTSIAFLASIILVIMENRKQELSLYSYGILFLVTGAMTSYMDLLSSPLITLGIPLILWISLSYIREDKNEIKARMQRLIHIIYLSAFWTVGYGGFWALKWIIGNFITGKNIIGRAFQQVELRSGALNTDTEISFRSAMRNVLWGAKSYFIIFFVVFAVISLFALWINKKKKIKLGFQEKEWIWEYAIPLCAVSIYPIVWYKVLYEHTYHHYWFAYRELAISVLAISMLLGTISLKNLNGR